MNRSKDSNGRQQRVCAMPAVVAATKSGLKAANNESDATQCANKHARHGAALAVSLTAADSPWFREIRRLHRCATCIDVVSRRAIRQTSRVPAGRFGSSRRNFKVC